MRFALRKVNPDLDKKTEPGGVWEATRAQGAVGIELATGATAGTGCRGSRRHAIHGDAHRGARLFLRPRNA
jgi:hypothetical protein